MEKRILLQSVIKPMFQSSVIYVHNLITYFTGAGLKAAISSHQGAVMIQVPEAGTKGKPNKPKSLNAPSVSKVRDLRSVRVSSGFVLFSKRCLECQEPMSGADHFK